MELTEKQKAAFQELAEWARKYDADIQGDEVDIIIEDTAFVLNHCSNQGVFIDMPELELSFKAKQEGGK
jgi:hypothetical protein